VIDFIRFEKQEQSTKKAFFKLEMQRQFYDPRILRALSTILNLGTNLPKIVVKLVDLKEGMILENRILTKRGLLVARKGQKVSEALLQIISHCLENKAIEGSIEVIKSNTDY
jgi:hypothetical protein